MDFCTRQKDLPSMFGCRTIWPSLLCGLLVCAALVAGCRTLEPPTDLAAAMSLSDADVPPVSRGLGIDPRPTATVESPVTKPAEPQELKVPTELADDRWLPTPSDPDSGAEPTYRWQHVGLDALIAGWHGKHPDFALFLSDDDAVVVANTAILLARSGDSTIDRCLAEAVCNKNLKLPLRRASVEALSGLDSALAGPALGELLDDFGTSVADGYSVELHADLLRALAHHVDAAASSCFADALQTDEGDVRQAGLYAYTISGAGVLPASAIELRSDRDPRVRAATLECLATRRHPQALQCAREALTDFHLDVRLAAIRALGELGGDDARATLQRLLIHEPEAVRSGAVLALAKSGDDVTVFASTNDPSWQVRRCVARSLAYFPTARGETIARQLLADRSGEVRRAVVYALDSWPLAAAGPILLTSLAEAPYPTRKQAAEQLARRWPPSQRYSADAPPESRAEQMAALQAAWQATNVSGEPWAISIPPRPAGDPAQGDQLQLASLTAHPAIPLPNDQVAGLLGELSSDEVDRRRAAAKQLAVMAAEQPLELASVEMLAELGMAETDALVWREMLDAVHSDGSPPAVRLAYVGTGHTAAEVRRLSCGYLAAHSDPRHLAVLGRLLDDPNSAVVRSAVEAFGVRGALSEPALLERLLTDEDGTLRVAAARSLAINGYDSGPVALVRLSGDSAAEIRRQAVTAMGQLRDAMYVESLVARLDDELSVKVASVASLTQIVGSDVTLGQGDGPPPLADQVSSWKQWWDNQRPVAANASDSPAATTALLPSRTTR
jgi:HEAT repeat protein